jgi:hypothetical protein
LAQLAQLVELVDMIAGVLPGPVFVILGATQGIGIGKNKILGVAQNDNSLDNAVLEWLF